MFITCEHATCSKADFDFWLVELSAPDDVLGNTQQGYKHSWVEPRAQFDLVI